MALTAEQYTTAAVFAGTFAFIYFVVNRVSGQRAVGHKSPPPSIGCLPIVGSLPYLPNFAKMHTFFAAKSLELGDVLSFRTGKMYTVVLNSHASLREAFVKRSADFADRPIFSTLKYTNPGRKGILAHSYNADFKKYHQLSLSILKEFGFGQNVMESRISVEVQQLIQNIKDLDGRAFDAKQSVSSAVINVISSMIFGRGLDNDERLKSVSFAMVNNLIKERRMVVIEMIPLIKILPTFRNVTETAVRVLDEFFVEVDKEIEQNLKAPVTENYIQSFIRHEGENFDREQLRHTIRDFVLAGMESSATTVLWALALLADHPDVQRRLQEEIDSVVPRDRLPSLDDKHNLPYVEAAILEVMRFKTIAPLGGPHFTMCDTEVGGYFIPKDTVIFPNLYAAHMDPNVWDKPHEFRPERFLDEEGNVANKDMMITFSLGKRSCLGEVLARQEVYLFFTGLVQQFHIRPPEGVDRINPKEDVKATLAPTPFEVRLIARDPASG